MAKDRDVDKYTREAPPTVPYQSTSPRWAVRGTTAVDQEFYQLGGPPAMASQSAPSASLAFLQASNCPFGSGLKRMSGKTFTRQSAISRQTHHSAVRGAGFNVLDVLVDAGSFMAVSASVADFVTASNTNPSSNRRPSAPIGALARSDAVSAGGPT